MSNWKTDGETIFDLDAVKAVSDDLGVLIDGTWVDLSKSCIEKIKKDIHIPDDREGILINELEEFMSKK